MCIGFASITSFWLTVYLAYNVTLDVFPSPTTCNSSIFVSNCVHSISEYTDSVTGISFPFASFVVNVSVTTISFNVLFPVLLTVIVYSITSPGLTFFPFIVSNVSFPTFFTLVAVFTTLIPGIVASGVTGTGVLGVSSPPSGVAVATFEIVNCASTSPCFTS